ncbi:MAG: hypothetical protein FDZ70_07095, partial [Actinobacteria bacterium]
MRRTAHLVALGASLALVWAASAAVASAGGVCALDTEPNDTPATAELILAPVSGTLSATDTLDVYRVATAPGESLEARLTHDFASDGSGDFDLYLFAPFTADVGDFADALTFSAAGPPVSSEYFRYRIPGAGEYYVVVRGFETTAEVVGYDLTVALDDAPAPLSGIER